MQLLNIFDHDSIYPVKHVYSRQRIYMDRYTMIHILQYYGHLQQYFCHTRINKIERFIEFVTPT